MEYFRFHCPNDQYSNDTIGNIFVSGFWFPSYNYKGVQTGKSSEADQQSIIPQNDIQHVYYNAALTGNHRFTADPDANNLLDFGASKVLIS